MSEPTDPACQQQHMSRVDTNPQAHQPTEDDEQDVLRARYGPPDARGFYGTAEAADGIQATP